MGTRFQRHRFPLLLMAIPSVWLVCVLFLSLRFDSVADEHAEHPRISKRGFLPALAIDDNDQHMIKIKQLHDTLYKTNNDVKILFQIKDELIKIAREKEEKLENLMKIDTLENTSICQPCLNQALSFGDNPISDFNPFLTRVKTEDKHLINEKDRELQLRGGTKNKPEVKEYGAVLLMKSLSLTDLVKYRTGQKLHKFNEYTSSLIPLNRSLPDFRNQACKDKHYDQELPAVTIIICFHNEAWSTLLRTIHSAINRAPGNLIQEVLLVDDNSNLDHLKEDLAIYLKRKLPLVRLIRSDVRLGLARARMLAVINATASVLVFLDSHVECFKGWLEPLLTPLLDDPNTIVTPVIDSINHNTFGVSNTGEGMVGVLNLSKLMFDWSKAPKRSLDLRKTEDDYYMSPTMAGLFSIYKDYFIKLGGYDEELQLWGSENLELSFKTWMCGGRILITPCSHIAHVFRSKSPYLNRNQRDIMIRNKARVANVWLDDYKKFFNSLENIDLDGIGNLTVQKKLKEDLKCNNFDWYIKHIYPEMYIPGTGPWFGEIINDGSKGCLKIISGSLEPAFSPCDETSNPWDSTSINEIRFYDICLDGSKEGQLKFAKCTGDQTSQVFIHTNAGFIVHQQSELCLTSTVGAWKVALLKCVNSMMQAWSWTSNPNYRSWIGL